MITLTGTYGIANETAPTGYVDIQPMVTAVRLSTIITQAPVRADLDNGAISVDIVASDDAGWDNGPIPYVFTERINGQSAQWMAYVNGPGPVDMSDLIPLDLPPDMYVPVPGPPNVLTVDSTTTGDPGTDADVTISGTSPEQALAFTIPRGDQGDVGPPPHIGDDEPTDPEIVEWFDTNEPSVRGVLNSGDTMTGPLILSGDAVDLLGATPLQQVAQKSMVGNLLTDNQASGTDTWGTTEGFSPYNCTLASSAAAPIRGTRSLRMTTTGASPTVYGYPLATNAPAVPDTVYTASAQVVVSDTANARMRIRFYTDGGANAGEVSGTYLGAGVSGHISVTAVAPTTAAYVTFYVTGNGATVGETIDLDDISLHAGAGGQWAMPGTPITGLGTRITRPSVDDRLVEQWNGSAWSVVDYDSGARNYTASTAGVLRRSGNAVSWTGTGTPPTGFRDTYATGEQFYITNDALPTSLPGTLVSPAPQ